MMKRERPVEIYFYEWYVSRWRASTTRALLDGAGRNVYRELLDTCYTQGGFWNPENDPNVKAALARDCGVTLEQFEDAWRVIKRHFIASKSEKFFLINKQSDAARRDYFRFRKQQREKGKLGGLEKSRRAKAAESNGYVAAAASSQGYSNGLATGLAESYPLSSQTRQDKTRQDTARKDEKKRGREEEEKPPFPTPAQKRFAQLLELYPNPTHTEAACQWFLSEWDRQPDPEVWANSIIEGIGRWLKSAAWHDKLTGQLDVTFIPSLAKFLGYPERNRAVSRMYLDHPPEYKILTRDIEAELKDL